MTEPAPSRRRDTALRTMLRSSGFADWSVEPLAGDASSRRYFRLGLAGRQAIVMDADPALGHDTRKFAVISKHLRDAGLCAPEIFAAAHDDGFLILEDLGATDLASHLARFPETEAALYGAATEMLLALRDLDPPAGLAALTPEVAGEMVEITALYYADVDPAPLREATTRLFARHAPEADRLALRDFHAENLIWRPERAGLDRLGLLDFQDAFLAPDGYDLVSLLRDIRREVSPEIVRAATARYAQAIGADEEFGTRLAVLGAQRNLRILGVFARLARTRGPTRHLTLIPRVWEELQKDLAHPALSDLRDLVARHLPPPAPAFLTRLTA